MSSSFTEGDKYSINTMANSSKTLGWWVFCLLIGIGLTFGLLLRPTVVRAAFTCTVGVDCTVTVFFGAQDPEGDSMNVTFNDNSASFYIRQSPSTGCTLTAQSQVTNNTVTTDGSSCTAPISGYLTGTGIFIATGTYIFTTAGSNYTVPWQVSDDAGHVTAGSSTVTAYNLPTNLTGVGADTTHIIWSWSPPATGPTPANYNVYNNQGQYLCTSTHPTTSCVAPGAGSIVTYSANSSYYGQVQACNADGCSAFTAPAVSAYTLPNAPTGLSTSSVTSSSIIWTWSAGTGGANDYVCTLNDANYTNATVCASPKTSSSLTCNTQYTLRVWARNAATPPRPSASSASLSQTTPDCIPGQLVITASPATPNNQITATFDWGVVARATSYDLQLDSGSVTTQTQLTKTYTGLSAGTHTFVACPVNVSGTGICDSRTWTIDTQAPNVASCNAISGTYYPNVSVSCNAGSDVGSPTTSVTAKYTTTGVDPTCASSNFSNPTTFSSTTTLKVRTCDAAGNSSAVTTYTYTISASNPITFTLPGSSGGWQNSVVSITLGVASPNGGLSARYNWDSAATSTVGTTFTNGTIISSPTGSHTLYVWAQDGVGMTNTSSAPYLIDPTPPSSVTLTLTGSPTTSSFNLSWTASDASVSGLSHYELWRAPDSGGAPGSWGGAPIQDNISGTSTTDTPAVGTWWYGVHTVDNAGNWSGEVSSRQGIKDNVPPTPNPPTLSASGQTRTSITWTLSVSSDGTGVGLHAQPYGFATTSGGPYTWQASNVWNEGSLTCNTGYTRYGVVRDSLGNQTSQASAASSTTSCDVTPPTITSVTSTTSNGAYTVGSAPINITVTFSEPVTSTGSVTVTLNTTPTARSCSFTITNATSGSCTYTVQSGDTSADLDVTISGTIKDQANNAMTNFTPVTNLAANNNIIIDTTWPVLSSLGTQANFTKTAPVVTWTASDTNPGNPGRVEVWRAAYDASTCNGTTMTGCSWSNISGNIAYTSGVPGSWTNTVATANVIYFYGLHVVDSANNCVTDQAQMCGSATPVAGAVAKTVQRIAFDTLPPGLSNQKIRKLNTVTRQLEWIGVGATTNRLRPEFSVDLSDLSGISNSTVEVKNSLGQVVWTGTYTTDLALTGAIFDQRTGNKPLQNGSYTVKVTSKDLANNDLVDDTWAFTVDNTPPGAPGLR